VDDAAAAERALDAVLAYQKDYLGYIR